ncbi:MAG: transglutaminase N-terminal domain-containing protein [Chitinophagales bacterium]
MIYNITHTTEYTYFDPVSLCHNIARLLPRNTEKQRCIHTSIEIFPLPDRLNEYEDFYGNKLIYFSIEKEHGKLIVKVRSEIDKESEHDDPSSFESKMSIEDIKRFLRVPGAESAEIRQYVFETPMTAWDPDIVAYAQQSFPGSRSVWECTKDLMHRIHKDFEFKTGFTSIATPLSVVMEKKKGVCQDFAHFAIACIRSLGLPARYISGYIETVSPEGKDKLIGVDASHAWFSVFIPDLGWVDFDPTNDLIPNGQHLTIGWGRDYSDIAPLKGIILSSGKHELKVFVDVKRQR